MKYPGVVKVLIGVFGYILAQSALSIDFRGINTSYWYDTEEVKVRDVVAQSGNVIYVFTEISFSDSIYSDSVRFLLQQNYEDNNHIEISQQGKIVLSGPKRLIFEHQLVVNSKKLLVVEYYKDGKPLYYPVDLLRGGQPFPSYFFAENDTLPWFESYVLPNQNIAFISGRKSLYGYQYTEDFPPADPPMGVVQSISPNLTIDSIITDIGGNLASGHFYFIQNDTLGTEGLSAYCGETYYPKPSRLEDLIPPLTYITRQSEMINITTASNTKQAFDKFWLNTYSSSREARTAIRKFYRKIRIANHLFTDYKQGWKTDRGIIHIMYGNPEKVYRSNSDEIWEYGDDSIFEFRIISNLFTPHLYILKRDDDFREGWISRVRIIRNNGG